MTDFRFICVPFTLFILDLKILSVTERHSGERAVCYCGGQPCRSFYTVTIKCLSRLQRSGRFRVGENFAFVFCGRKAFGGNVIKPGYLIRFVPFPFCYTPKQLQPAEGRF